jgi:probable phosphoglycerate mutase
MIAMKGRWSGYDMRTAKLAVFVRHGESVSNVQETVSRDLNRFPLTNLGREQAAEAGIALKMFPKIDSFYTSPILRARQTAGIISKFIGIRPVVDRLLMERNFGNMNNMRFRSKVEHKRFVLRQIEEGYPDYESWDSMMDRMRKFSGRLKPGKITVAVSHREPISPAMSLVLEKDEMQMWSVAPLNGSITIIDFSKKGADAILAFGSPALPKRLFI